MFERFKILLKRCVYTGGDTGVATLPQKEVGASAEAEEREKEEEETVGW